MSIKEFTFRFYSNEKHLTTKTFHTSTIEEAYKMADNVLHQNKRLDDWQCIYPKINNIGSQKSPFGIGS